MSKLTMCLGLPGSGKSTWAADQRLRNLGGIAVVNKDSIRADLVKKGWVWSPIAEAEVIKIRDKKILEALDAGMDVISDDTNLAPRHQTALQALAHKARATFETQDFRGVDVATCIERDSTRTGPARVGRAVIVKMAKDYLNYQEPTPTFAPWTPTVGLPNVVICDLDGTLALHNGRSPYDYMKCDTDVPNPPVVAVLNAMLGEDFEIVFMSGRDDSCRAKTEKWLESQGLGGFPLYMRSAGDSRKDWIVKGELFDANIRGKYNVVFCLDDRDQVVTFYRKLGLTVFQVAPGNF